MRVWSLIIGAGLLIAGILGAIALALDVVSDEMGGATLYFDYTEFGASTTGGSGSEKYTSNELANEEGIGKLKAGFPLLLTGMIVACLFGALGVGLSFSRIPYMIHVIFALVGSLGLIMMLIAPLLVASGAGDFTDGALDGDNAAAGYWLAITGFIVGTVGILAGGVASVFTRSNLQLVPTN